jgi:hypothetical protein
MHVFSAEAIGVVGYREIQSTESVHGGSAVNHELVEVLGKARQKPEVQH